MMPGQTQPALLFMPDISGFTQFVSETEISHSQHIVQELLEIIIDSNHLNLQISEIEGDAIFFYKPGDKPDLKEPFATGRKNVYTIPWPSKIIRTSEDLSLWRLQKRR